MVNLFLINKVSEVSGVSCSPVNEQGKCQIHRLCYANKSTCDIPFVPTCKGQVSGV
jgi:hypothetical protein